MTTLLIPIVWKKPRNVVGFKYWGGLLNPNKQFYVRKITGNHNPMPILEEARYKHGTQLP